MFVVCLAFLGKTFYAYSGQEQIQEYLNIIQIWESDGTTRATTLVLFSDRDVLYNILVVSIERLLLIKKNVDI